MQKVYADKIEMGEVGGGRVVESGQRLPGIVKGIALPQAEAMPRDILRRAFFLGLQCEEQSLSAFK